MLLVGALAASGCFGSEPEWFLDVTPSVVLPDSVRSSAPFEITYQWDLGDQFETQGHDYLVFVHLVNTEGSIVAQDDHSPPVPISEWSSGDSIEYRRWFRFLDPIEVEHLDVVVGLYDAGGRAALKGPAEPTYPNVGRLEILPDRQTGIPLRGRGWEDLERSATSGELWHWLGDEATVVFTNPRRDSLLHMEARAPIALLGSSQRVTVSLDGAEIASFEISTDERFLKRILVSAEALGGGEFVEFRIAAASSVASSDANPGSVSDRRLGLKVFYLHLGGR